MYFRVFPFTNARSTFPDLNHSTPISICMPVSDTAKLISLLHKRKESACRAEIVEMVRKELLHSIAVLAFIFQGTGWHTLKLKCLHSGSQLTKDFILYSLLFILSFFEPQGGSYFGSNENRTTFFQTLSYAVVRWCLFPYSRKVQRGEANWVKQCN